MPIKTKTEKDLIRELLALRAPVKEAAYESESDLRRTHLNNIAGAIVGLANVLEQEKAWKRP